MAGRSNKRLNGSDGRALVAADFALGVGWGSTVAAPTVVANSKQDRWKITITSSGSSQAQATATIVFTFPEPYPTAPFAIIDTTNDNSLTAASAFTWSSTTTALTLTHSILPVDTKIYTVTCILVV